MNASLRNLAKRINIVQKGFTLIEMIVVVGIIAVLAAVIIPNIGKFIGSGESGAKDAENESVQTAMNAMMADRSVNVVTAEATTARNDWSTYPIVTGGDPDTVPLYGSTVGLQYLLEGTTVYFYCFDANGKITGQHETAASC